MANPESSDSPQVKLVRECCRGFQTRDLDLAAKSLHKDFRYVPYPKSLGRPEQTKEEWLEQYAKIMSLWTADSEPTLRFIADTPGKVVVHVRTEKSQIHRIYLSIVVLIPQTTNKSKTTIGVERNSEAIFIIDIVTDEDGSLKINKFEEFTDSKAYLDFAQAIAAAGAGKQ